MPNLKSIVVRIRIAYVMFYINLILVAFDLKIGDTQAAIFSTLVMAMMLLNIFVLDGIRERILEKNKSVLDSKDKK